MEAKKSKDERIIWEIYRRLFKSSEPEGDFDKLVENAIIDEKGMKHIPFNDYVIDLKKMDEIINTALKEFKVPKWRRQSFKFAIYLGCSPKTKDNERDNN